MLGGISGTKCSRLSCGFNLILVMTDSQVQQLLELPPPALLAARHAQVRRLRLFEASTHCAGACVWQ